MNAFLEMPLAARLYICAVSVCGVAAIVIGIVPFHSDNLVQFAAYLSVAVIASVLKVNLPTITGTMSVNSLLFLIAIVQLKQCETLVIGVTGVFIQCVWKTKSRVLPTRVVFSVTANALAISAAYVVYNQRFGPQHLEGIRVLAAACTQFTVNTSLIAIVVAATENKSVLRLWTECYFWCFPYYIGGAGIAWISTVLNRSFDWQVSFVLLPVVYFVYRSYKLYLQRLEADKKHVEEMAGLHLRTIEALALAIEAKDHTTHDHLRRVRVYALELGERMGLTPMELQSLRAAALLHDIGKLAVPEHIISKPGKLTHEEFEKMKIHPVVGAQILEQVQFPYPVAPIVLSHHEKWDGSGYPHGLKGTEIPLGARILSAVDCLDALASDRQYRRALPLDKAMEIVVGEAGRAFDPAVVRLLQSCYAELEQNALAQPQATLRLDTDMVVSRGAAPATGFEQQIGLEPTASSVAVKQVEPSIAAAEAREAFQDLHEWSCLLEGSVRHPPVNLQEILAIYAVRMRGFIAHDAIVFYMRNENHLVAEFCGGQNRKLFSSLRIPWGEGLSGWVADNRKPMLNGNPSVEAGYLNDPTKFSTLCSALAVPLETHDGVVGVLALYRAERDAFSSTDLRTLVSIGSRISLALEQVVQQRSLAGNKTLTNLPGVRGLFIKLRQEIDRCCADRGSFALVVIELDSLAELTRRVGSYTCERIIGSFANGFSEVFPSPATVAHLGGDEFALILPDVTADQLERELEKIHVVATIAGRQKPDSIHLTHTVGLAHCPADCLEPEALLAKAEERLYRTKTGRRVPIQNNSDPALSTVRLQPGIQAAP